ncbi:sugar ABC transporter ATP-binding protein [Gemmobacter nanjingensis]|uniref:Sugar ABC transporter ATP-binding protein n=1 Tax=Gemmobacter nanjingensis TaxID=488454 RepID=A0ABQ3FIS9_9RHOB|nr:sn-glycerol-3-phosphate ABC transporter ATP-binding protein UgpC [Gemmobacter nanjingensis]GHC25505.1 sugar ABC transporter ATP-binding protein [Gemmobacter nanjingensis]
MADLRLTGVKKDYGGHSVIKGVDLEIRDGEFVVFVGPSGCGKSTLLRMIAGLEEISDGTLDIGGKRANDLSPRDRGIAMVFQSYALYPHLTVAENMGFGLSLRKTPRAEATARVARAAEILQITHLLDRKPSQLSGGQRQRVAIGRAIVREPSVFLFDEPLSNLDAALRMDMRMEIARLHRDLGATMIYVTHDQVEAMTLADRIVVLNGGIVQQVGRPIDLFRDPCNAFVAGFIGSPRMNFLPVTVDSLNGGMAQVSAAGVGPVAVAAGRITMPGPAILGIRPQALKPDQAADRRPLHGHVVLLERMGTETVVNLRLHSGQSVLAVVPGDLELQPGQDITFSFAPADARLFPASDLPDQPGTPH